MKTKRLPLGLSLCAVLWSGCSAPSADGYRLLQGDQVAPIINGVPDDDPAHAAVVALTLEFHGAFCSGTLIAEDVILTAAHCLDSGIGTSTDVYFGQSTHDDPGEYVDVTEVRIHPKWNTDDLQNGHDVALLRIANTPAGITPIPALPKSEGLNRFDVGEDIVFSGFGRDENDLSGNKLRADGAIAGFCTVGPCDIDGLPIASYSIGYWTLDAGTCHGDSGGPAFIMRGETEYVAGIASYVLASGDGDCRGAGVSADASAFDSFIQAFIDPDSVPPEACDSNTDDDGDGFVDCEDPDCQFSAECGATDACESLPTIGCGETIQAPPSGAKPASVPTAVRAKQSLVQRRRTFWMCPMAWLTH